jgi:hypothetical protein
MQTDFIELRLYTLGIYIHIVYRSISVSIKYYYVNYIVIRLFINNFKLEI